jgi:hypothetical protein
MRMRPQVQPTLFSWICEGRFLFVFPILDGFFYLHPAVQIPLSYSVHGANCYLLVDCMFPSVLLNQAKVSKKNMLITPFLLA